MKRAIQLLNNIRSDKYISQSENELGELKNSDWLLNDREDTVEEKEHNRKVFERSHEIEESEWKELWTIFEGQDYEEYKSLYDSLTEEEKREKYLWYEWFDGSGIKGWWD
jgi:Fe-S cluster assembly scaffold protein SufB